MLSTIMYLTLFYMFTYSMHVQAIPSRLET
ncbi:Protein of unknown function [Bacillus toyonensis]|nr:Protein of unknown function [Bacillus toyonensis]